MFKDIVILTKSRKDNGYCVAGIDVETGKWLRLVSPNPQTRGALTDYDMRLTNGEYCKPGDLVRVELKSYVPKGCQTENHLIVYGNKWIKLGEKTIYEIIKIHTPNTVKKLFGDSLPCLDYNNFTYSLILAKVEKLRIYYNNYGSRKAEFMYQSVHYKGVSVTDIDYRENNFCQSEFAFNDAYIVVSIPNEPHDKDGKYYKFIAKIFPYEKKDFDFDKSYTIKEIVETFEFPIPIRKDSWSNDFYCLVNNIKEDKAIGNTYIGKDKNQFWSCSLQNVENKYYVYKDKNELRYRTDL